MIATMGRVDAKKKATLLERRAEERLGISLQCPFQHSLQDLEHLVCRRECTGIKVTDDRNNEEAPENSRIADVSSYRQGHTAGE